MPDIEIKRGYEVLPDNNVRFGIRVINNSDFAISEVEVLLDYSDSLFGLSGNKVHKLGTIPPAVPRTAKFILKPLGCIHKENIGATIIYKDHQWKKHTIEMHPKEVHCVCPFLKEKVIKRADFLTLLKSGFFEERGVNFEGITVEKLVEFISHTCKSRLYRVDEFPIENGKIIYLAGDALGEKAYYLLTAVVKEYEGLTQVLLRANSDKNYGLNGFLNEILDNLRHLVISASAREIGTIRKEQVINIIDSVVQRSIFSVSDGAPSVNVRDSVVQRAEIKVDEERKRREEERLRKEREEQELIAKERKENIRVERTTPSKNKFFAVALVLGLLALGYWGLVPGVSDSPQSLKSTPSPTATIIQTPKVSPTVLKTPAIPQEIITQNKISEKNRIATIVTEKGTIKFELYEKETPITTKNFIDLAQKGFYDGLTFHRVEPGFVIQGGDPKGDGIGGSNKTIPLEINATLSHIKGAVGMGRTQDRNSASSQFYICLGDAKFLDGNYAVFGQVIAGQDIAEKITKGDKMIKVTIGGQ